MLKPKVAIVYLSYHSEPYIDDVVASLKNISYPKDRLAFVVVDNPHLIHGLSMPHLQDYVLPLSNNELPEVILLPQKENLGFAGGNNVGIQWALDNGFDYILFHNNDGMFATGAIEPLVEAMENDKTIGIAQSLILLYPETDLINSSGNAYHYLGMAYCANLRVPKDKIKIISGSEIGYAMGAAVMMRADLLRQYGLWDADYFMYHEDL
ncbi:MAG: glycosyltransferase family 2 protein, partial [bacterium]|nr:glycosyltransferase family 2 protein [bacterium]